MMGAGRPEVSLAAWMCEYINLIHAAKALLYIT